MKNKNFKYTLYCFSIVLIMITGTTLITLLFKWLGVDKVNLLMLFLINVLLVTIATRGYLYGFLSAILSVFLFNYLYTVPLHTLRVASSQDILLIFFFLLAALICGLMATKLKTQREIANENAKVANQLYEITESFLQLSGIENIINNSLHYLWKITNRPCQIKLTEQIIHDFSSEYTLSEVYKSQLNVIDPESYNISYPIVGINQHMGTLYFQGSESFTQSTEKIILTIIYQTALVLDREYLYMEREKIRVAMESEHLKSTLLRSISHDIRTPLTGIQGSASVLSSILEKAHMEEPEKGNSLHLISNITDETTWLVMTVQNVLNLTRINEGKLDVNTDYESVDDLFEQIDRHIPLSYNKNRLKIEMPKEIYLIKVDGNLFIQVLINMIDNSFKHAGEEAHIWLRAFVKENKIYFQVEDDGVGIDPSIQEHLFDSFTTCPAHEADKGRGIGIGLAICKSIIEAFNGTIHLLDNQHTIFEIEMDYENGDIGL